MRSKTVEVLDSRDLASELNIIKAHVKILSKDLFAEIKDFQFELTLQVTFSKPIEKDETRIYFYYKTKIVISHLDLGENLQTFHQTAL